MDQKIIPTRRFNGQLKVPSDKSLTHRAVLLSSLAEGRSTIKDPLNADDCLSTVRCVEQLGVPIKKDGAVWTVDGQGLWSFKKPMEILDCGNSGTTMRLISGILAGQDFETELTGDASLVKRPMDRVANPLMAMGTRFDLTHNKYPPLKITGTRSLNAIQWKNPVASAQVKSAVLLAGLHAQGVTVYEEPSLSRDHTERMLAACGVGVDRDGFRVSLTGPSRLTPQTWLIPGDFSSAAFFLVGALLIDGSDLMLEGVNLNPTRVGLLGVLNNMGASIQIRIQEKGGEPIGDIVLKGRADLKAVQVGASAVVSLLDEIPILAVAATQAQGRTVIKGAGELRLKETDRLSATAKNLRAMGASVEEVEDGLIVTGPTPLRGAEVESFGDHRVAMALAIAGLIADGETVIKEASCVGISYPAFWEHLERLCSM